MRLRWAVISLLAVSMAFSQEHAAGDLRRVLEQQQAAWNRGDLDGFMQSYWHSPGLTFFSGDTITKGWDATLARYQTKYQAGSNGMGQLTFTDQQVEMLGPAGAVVTARWHLLGPDGQKREGLTTVICRKTADGWKIVHDHSS